MTLKPCLECGELSESSRCVEHRPAHRPKALSPRSIGYDAAWDRLSRRARALQPFCTLCGATEDLTTDHSVEAWERKAKGLSIRLVDVRVLCRSCNARAGRARPGGMGSDAPSGSHGSRQSLALCSMDVE